jgi:hypothetical protein
MRFVLVRDRIPRSDAYCALCCSKIGATYTREIATRLFYCNPQCYAGHVKVAVQVLLQNRSRRKARQAR